ncbi:Histone deacetylation protein Rxt3 [Gracilaria domingensis]|nr:Histone deacetylation protein Rxt3 [Gracilaria domingensis]
MDVEKLLKARTERAVAVHIPSDHFSQSNAALRNRFLWGTDAYTDDSDLVAVLVHAGFATLESKPNFEYLTVKLKLQRHVPRFSPPFTSSERHGLSSRAWSSSYNGARMSIQSVQAVAADRKYVKRRRTSALPTMPLPGIVSTPRASVSKAAKAPHRKPATSICFDMLNKPCQLYNINQVASLGDDERNPLTRLQREVLYVENESHRYEVCRVQNRPDVVRFGQVKGTALKRQMLAQLAPRDVPPCPMCKAELTNVEELPWNKLEWDIRGVTVNGVWHPLTKISFQKLRQ